MVELGPLNNLNVEKLLEYAEPSPFGRGTETIYDENVRSAKEIKATLLGVKSNGVEEIDKLVDMEHIQQSAIGFFMGSYSVDLLQCNIEFTKLNIYGPGDFFLKHKDTPHSKSHVGTLVVVLPSKYEGGEFVIYDRFGEESVVETDKENCVMMFTDVDHEVRKVRSGHRITLTANIEFSKRDERDDCLDACTIFDSESRSKGHVSEGVGSLCEESLKLVKKEKEFGVLLYHEYMNGLSKEHLKGIDKDIYSYFESKGYFLELSSVICNTTYDVVDGEQSFTYHQVPTGLVNLGEEISIPEKDKKFDEKKLIVFTTGAHKQIFHITGAERTGNEGLEEENFYYNTALIIKKTMRKI
uniref:Fe2OG dioxygenase domain-containing protein n=1 Tax=Arcella intermedia TaxID=1963864 RepID=A0A6B2L7Y4_9EUKA